MYFYYNICKKKRKNEKFESRKRRHFENRNIFKCGVQKYSFAHKSYGP